MTKHYESSEVLPSADRRDLWQNVAVVTGNSAVAEGFSIAAYTV